MTMSQQKQIKMKPLSFALTSILISTCSLCQVAVAATISDGMVSSQPATTNTTPIPMTTTTPDTTAKTPVKATDTSTPTTVTKSETKTTVTESNTNPEATPLNQSNMSDSSILNWATNAAKAAYSYDFKNYNQQMQQIQTKFTPQGWTAFMNALNKSNNLHVVQNRKLVASATPIGKATILQQGLKNGLYTWKIEIPLLATYESESRLIKQNLDVTMLVTRDHSPDGVGISHFVAVIVPTGQPITSAPTMTTPAPIPVATTTAPGTTTTPSSPMTGATTNTPPNTGVTVPNTMTTSPNTPGTATPPTVPSGTAGTTPSTMPNTSVTPGQGAGTLNNPATGTGTPSGTGTATDVTGTPTPASTIPTP